MIDLMHVALPKSDLGQALLHADEKTEAEDFRGFIDTDALRRQIPSCLPTGRFVQLADGDPDLALLDEQGTRQRVNRFCDLMAFTEEQLNRHLRHILMARQLILDADKRAFEKGLWLVNRADPAQNLSTILALEEEKKKAQGTYFSYELLSTLRPEFGAPPIIVDGAHAVSQFEFLQEYVMNSELCIGTPKRRVEVLVVTGFKSRWHLIE